MTVQPADGRPIVVATSVSSHTQAGPRLAATPDGGLVAAYVVERAVEGRRFPASELEVARSDNGGRTWSRPVRPYPDAGVATGHTFHSLAVGGDGTVVVAWLDGTAKDRARSQTADVGHGNHHAQGTVREGAVQDRDEPGTQLLLAASRDGGRSFAAPTTVASGTCQCCRTALTVADDGAIYAGWRHLFPGGERDMAVARSDDGGATFTAPVRVHRDGWAIDGCPHSGPALTTDGDGALHVAWSTGAPDRMGAWHTASADRGATFAAEGIRARLPDAPGASAVRVMVGALVGRGVLTRRRDGRRKLYALAEGRETSRRRGLAHLRDTLFGGSAAEVVAALLDGGDVTEAEIDRLAALVERAKSERADDPFGPASPSTACAMRRGS